MRGYEARSTIWERRIFGRGGWKIVPGRYFSSLPWWPVTPGSRILGIPLRWGEKFQGDLLCSSVSCHFLKLACSQHVPKYMPKLTWNALDAWSQGKWLKFNSKGRKVLSFVLNISWSLEESHISAAFGCFYGCWCHSHRWGSPMPSQIRMVSDAWLRDGVTGGRPLNTVGRLGIHSRHMKIGYSKYTYMHRHAYIRT